MTVMVPMHQTLVMPLKNGTQKEIELGPDFRRDDAGVEMTKKGSPREDEDLHSILLHPPK